MRNLLKTIATVALLVLSVTGAELLRYGAQTGDLSAMLTGIAALTPAATIMVAKIRGR